MSMMRNQKNKGKKMVNVLFMNSRKSRARRFTSFFSLSVLRFHLISVLDVEVKG